MNDRHPYSAPQDLDWLAYQFVDGMLSDDEAAAFEDRLANDEQAQAALIRTVEMLDCLKVIGLAEEREPSQSAGIADHVDWHAESSSQSNGKTLNLVSSALPSQAQADSTERIRTGLDNRATLAKSTSKAHVERSRSRAWLGGIALVLACLALFVAITQRPDATNSPTAEKGGNGAGEDTNPELLLGWMDSMDAISDLPQIEDASVTSDERFDPPTWIDRSIEDGVREGSESVEADWMILALENFEFDEQEFESDD